LLGERVPHVLSCIYPVFTEAYWSTVGPSAIRDELCDEGVRLSGELCALMPDEREGHALAALVLLHDSRRANRVDGEGALVPLDEQDGRQWDRGKIARGLDRLRRAEGSGGPYLPQAVIAAVHATAASWEQTDWATVCAAYDQLLRLTDSPVVRTNRALAVGFRNGPEVGLDALEQAAHDPGLARSNLVLTVRADLLRRAGRYGEAAQAYKKALTLHGSESGRAFLRRRIGECAAQG
jgi:RNA polymerase sigma-70 factor (ECF subfamily)